MIEAKFYLLPEDTLAARWRFVAQLCQTIINRQRKIFIYLNDEEACGQLDEALWASDKSSFLPHGFAEDTNDVQFPIEIGHTEAQAEGHFDCIILLSDELPKFFSRFKTLVEILPQESTILENGRKRFAHYRKLGMKIDTIDRRVPV